MMKNIKTFLVSLAAAAALFFPFMVPSLVAAQSCSTSASGANICDSLCSGANLSTNPSDCAGSTAEANNSVNNIIKTVINIFSLVVGVVAVIMIIIGGLRYITSGGDSGNVTNAKNTILYAIIGLVIVALAQIIVKFVLGRVTTSG